MSNEDAFEEFKLRLEEFHRARNEMYEHFGDPEVHERFHEAIRAVDEAAKKGMNPPGD